VGRVRNATPLVSGPASVAGSDGASITVRVDRPGAARAAGEWTRPAVGRPGLYRINSS